MNQQTLCYQCEHPITEHGYRCINCSSFYGDEIVYCQRCVGNIKHRKLNHNSIPVDYTQTTYTQLIDSIIGFEKLHLPKNIDSSKVFPYSDDDSPIWKRNNFSEITYPLPNEDPLNNNISFNGCIPFVCDYLRMNNSLKYLAEKLNLKLCSTDVIILLLKYSSFDIRLFIIEQLCIFQRAIPIYFGVPFRENLSMKYYFLMREMLQLLLPYTYQEVPCILSFGTQSCKGKTLLLNTILKTNFDCHQEGELNFETASVYYHNQLIQMMLGCNYATDKDSKNRITRNYRCHVFDLHGTHDWNEMPSFLVEFMSVIIIHMDASDVSQISSFAWPSVTFNQTATYLIFVHGEISDSNIEELQPQLLRHFGSNAKNVQVYRAKAILNGTNSKTLKLGVTSLLKETPIATNSLLNIYKKSTQQYNINLSTSANTLLENKQLLDEFNKILETLSKDEPTLDLFPLSRLKELSEKSVLSPIDEQLKDQLTKKRHEQEFNKAHCLITRLAELSINDGKNIILFEKAVLLWNNILWQQKREELHTPPISMLQHLVMNKERFLHELQERSIGYTNLHGRHCSFDDTNQMRDALIQIYRHSFQSQEYIEIINATSSTTYQEIFSKTFYESSEDLKNFFVIGMIGEQSTGKSFLINKVFGTKITEHKFKCTTGILATRVNIIGHENVKDIIILDTEGLLDQSKKDFEAQIFDRKMVLAVMARSHVVMINIKANFNKTMQQILEIVFYGLNKLHITNKPKLIFLFRDQDPKTMGEAKQREHVSEVMKDIAKSCEKVNFDVQNIINGIDVHEFPSPFVDLVVGERELSFFNDSFCQKALSLRTKVIDYLQNLTQFNSFEEWLVTTLTLWQQINYNSNLFDFESLVHLTLEKELETFCNHVLTDANSILREIMSSFKNEPRSSTCGNEILLEIEHKLTEEKEELINDLYNKLSEEKRSLMQKHNLESFPGNLFGSTQSRIKSSLDLYRTDHLMAATRQFQQDQFQKKLSEIPKNLSMKIREIQSVSENTTQFETLFNNTSMALLEEFERMLKTDERKQAGPLNNQLIKNFVEQTRIDNVGVKYFRQKSNDLFLNKIVQYTVLLENQVLLDMPILPENTESAGNRESTENSEFNAILSDIQARIQISLDIQEPLFSDDYFGRSLYVLLASSALEFYQIGGCQIEFENFLSFLRTEYTALGNGPYYNSNFLPIPELANECVQHIRQTTESNNIRSQQMINMWYTCYGIMLNIFCDKHYNYIYNKLVSEFKQEIVRTKEEVRQYIFNATTTDEDGQDLIKQIWAIIQNDIQKQFLNDFERFFASWKEYCPSIISEKCVYDLFRSKKYRDMFNYIRNPVTFIKNWLRSKFDEKYSSQVDETIFSLSLHLEATKKKLHRMILAWYEATQGRLPNRTVSELTNSLKEFLTNGQHTEHDITLTESTGGFPILNSAAIRLISQTAHTDRLLNAIYLTSKKLLDSSNESIKESTKNLISEDQLRDRLFDQFYNTTKGCGTPCPYCKQVCDNDNPMHTEHRTEHHLLWAFGGYTDKDTGKPRLICCTSNEAYETKVKSLREEDAPIPFAEHLKKFNPTWKIINRMTSLEDSQLKAYIALEEDLAKIYKFTGRADAKIRKKYLRATVTAHCYGFLVGIDYENTPNSLDGIPSHDVSCIEKQLKYYSIAYPENLCVLKNNHATKDNILTKLNTIINNMDERSTFIFYFSGHGGRTTTSKCYLVTSDNEKLTADDLAYVIGRAKTKKIILMLDSCYSGGMSNPFSFNLNNCLEGIHILCSSRAVELSMILERNKNSFFTKHLIKGLQGKFSCESANCNECATRTENLREAAIRKVTSTELALYLNHAITGHHNFAYTAINGSDFDISFLN